MNEIIKMRYVKHYLEKNMFVIAGFKSKDYCEIHLKPNEAIELLGDLQKYLFNNIKFIGDDEEC